MTPPSLFVITDRASAARAGRGVRDTVVAALEGGAPAILLRDKTMAVDERRRLGVDLAASTRAAGAQLWVTGDAELARALDADGLHLPAATPRPPDWSGPCSRSCHDRIEVARARREGATHVLVAPVAPTASKPGYGPALGADGVRALVDVADGMPVVALGGVTADNVALWRAAGATALAVMGGVMAAPDPAATVRALRAAWDAAPSAGPPATDQAPTDQAATDPAATDPAPTHRTPVHRPSEFP